MKENQEKRTDTLVNLRTSKVITDLITLFETIIDLDIRDLRRLTANYAWLNWLLTVEIFYFWRLTVNPIENLLGHIAKSKISRFYFSSFRNTVIPVKRTPTGPLVVSA